MINKKIETDIRDEFLLIKKDLIIHLTSDFDIEQKREFLKNHIPKEIIYKSELLLDTLLNYLMDRARNELKNANVELQNRFFKADFRKRINEWTVQLEYKLKLDPEVVKYSTDPRLKQGLIAGGITFVLGALTTSTIAVKAKTVSTIAGKAVVSFNPYMVTAAIIAGLATLIISSIIFKKKIKKATSKYRETVIADIEIYLENAELQVHDWLKKVINAFTKDFSEFCAENGFKLNGEIE